MPFSPKQYDVLRFNNEFKPRITILEGAVRSGKTWINNLLWLMHVNDFANQHKRFIMTGTTIASLQRNVLSEIEYMTGNPVTLNKHNEFEMLGNTMCCFGSDKIDSYKAIKGFTAFGWLGNELTEHHANTIDQCIKRCSGDYARIFGDTNPSGPEHPIKTNYIDRDGEKLKDGSVHIKSWHFVLDDNPFLNKTYVESLKRSIPSGVFYDRDILGLWVAAEGMIYRDFNSSIHVIDEPAQQMVEYFGGIDWGFEHNGVISVHGLDHDGNDYRLHETVEKNRQLEWWINEARNMSLVYKGITFYADPSRPDNIAAMQSAGIDVQPADNEVIEGISYVAGRYKLNRSFIVRAHNKNYLKEIYMYRWKVTSLKEEPIKENDDSMDSDRYAKYSRLGKDRTVRAVKSLYR